MSKNSKGAGKRKNLSFSSLNRFMVIEFVLMILLSLGITQIIASRARENAKEHLSAVTDERAQIIINYVENAETVLDAFSVSPIIQDLLEAPNDKDFIKSAQSYTIQYGNTIPGLDSLYICDYYGKALAHTSPDSVGLGILDENHDITDIQKALEGSITSENASGLIYSGGVMKSTSTGDTVVSIYKGVYKSNTLMGFVGVSIKTQSLIEKLEKMQTPGLERSFYSMIDVRQRVYVFDEDMKNSCEPLVLPDLLEQCDIYQNFQETESTTYEFKLPKGAYAGGQYNGGSFVGASYFIPQYHWLLMMNDFQSEVYTLASAMRIFLGIFSALILIMLIIFAFLNKKQEKVNQKLLSSVEAVNETKKSLNTAMFGDILTGVGNRVKLATDLMGINDGKTNPYYFALFNIMEFSNINTAYGSDTGDSLLVRTADTLKAQFPTGEVYRTGSDEFVVMVKTRNNTPQMSEVLFSVDESLKKLLVPENVRGLGTLYPKYKVAAIKKTSDIDASVITILKEMTNVKGEAMCGMIDFVDMSE